MSVCITSVGTSGVRLHSAVILGYTWLLSGMGQAGQVLFIKLPKRGPCPVLPSVPDVLPHHSETLWEGEVGWSSGLTYILLGFPSP